MPFVSQAQEGWAHEHPEEFGEKNLAEWDAATKGRHLPKRAHMDEKDKERGHGEEHHESREHRSEHGGEHEHHEARKPEGKHHPYKRTTIDHYKDGSKHILHEHESDPEQNSETAVDGHDAMMDNLHEHLSPDMNGAGAGGGEEAAREAGAANPEGGGGEGEEEAA